MSFGFIITRHVNSELTNKYWNECIVCIRQKYQFVKIIVIDDNSDKTFLKSNFEYINVEYIQSEYIGRGELLPYYYFHKNHYFDNAIILHDSAFIQSNINFNYLIKQNIKVIPIWHFDCEKKENVGNTIRIINSLKNNNIIINTLINDNHFEILSVTNKWSGCFGTQSFINYDFLCTIQTKYNLFNMLQLIKSRADRCCLERIMGIIFFTDYLKSINCKSLLGDITAYCKWGYKYQDYYHQKISNKKILKVSIVKVWSGR
jgi:hypothetical protein